MKELKFNIQYMLRKKEFFIALLITVLINLIHALLVTHNMVMHNTVVENSYSAEYLSILYNPLIAFNVIIVLIFPIVCSMIFSDSDWLEETMKTSNMLYTRINHRKNKIIRLILTFSVTVIITFTSFMINYLVLRIIFPSGNLYSYTQEIGFYLLKSDFFLDAIRIHNPVLFIVLINLSVSIALGILSGFSYACSFFVKNRIVLYFMPFIYIVVNEVVVSIINLKEIAIAKTLQPFGKYSISNYCIALGITAILGITLLTHKLKQKDQIL